MAAVSIHRRAEGVAATSAAADANVALKSKEDDLATIADLNKQLEGLRSQEVEREARYKRIELVNKELEESLASSKEAKASNDSIEVGHLKAKLDSLQSRLDSTILECDEKIKISQQSSQKALAVWQIAAHRFVEEARRGIFYANYVFHLSG